MEDGSGGLASGGYDLWLGEWYRGANHDEILAALEDNVYDRLSVSAVHASGFSYSFESRVVPYGPNAAWTGDYTAEFVDSLRAEDPDTGHEFTLRINPQDRQDRVIDVQGDRPGALSWSPPDLDMTVDGRWVFRR